MKTILSLLASLTLFGAVASAHPGCETPRRIVGYTRCGDPIIATYERVGSTRCGEPIFQWVTHYPRERERQPTFSVPLPGFSLYWGGYGRDHRDWDHDGCHYYRH